MKEYSWNNYESSIAIYLNGYEIQSVGPKGQIIIDDSFYIIFNAYFDDVDYVIPIDKYGKKWAKVIDTFCGSAEEENDLYEAGQTVKVPGRTTMVFNQKGIILF